MWAVFRLYMHYDARHGMHPLGAAGNASDASCAGGFRAVVEIRHLSRDMRRTLHRPQLGRSQVSKRKRHAL